MVWTLHLLLKAELERYGIEVKTTRANKDKDMELTARGRASKGCDLFLSIHSNAVGNGVNESVDYVAVYHLTNDTTTNIDEQSKELAVKIAPVIADTIGTKQGGRTITRKAGNDRNGDGLMNDNYYGVLHGARTANTPGLILEHSFHTNTAATKWLMDHDNLQRMAQVEAGIIAEYFGVEKAEGTDAESDGSNAPTKIDEDGLWGKGTTTRLQQIFGTPVDGEVSNQWAMYKETNPGLVSGWDWQKKPNGKGSQLIKAMQKWAGMSIFHRDGEIGPATIKALQKKLGTPVDGKVSNPSQMVEALQKWANGMGGSK
jgi:hypothetical protein